jgi:hypothetical protein
LRRICRLTGISPLANYYLAVYGGVIMPMRSKNISTLKRNFTMSNKQTHPQVLAKNLIQAAVCDAKKAETLLQNPAQYFRQGGVDIPADQEHEFNQFFRDEKRTLVTHLSLHAKAGQLSCEAQDHLLSLALPSFACCACSVSAYTVALAIVAVGTAGLLGLTVESAPVVALAAFAGVSAGAALAFICTLGAAISGGPKSVTKDICRWTGAC